MNDIDSASIASHGNLSVAVEPVPGLAQGDVASLAQAIDRIKEALHLAAPKREDKGHKRPTSGIGAYVFTRLRGKDAETSDIERSLDSLKQSVLTLGDRHQQHLRRRPSLSSRRMTSGDAIRLSTVNEHVQASPPRPDLEHSHTSTDECVAQLQRELEDVRAGRQEAEVQQELSRSTSRESQVALPTRFHDKEGLLNLHLKRHAEERNALQQLIDHVRSENALSRQARDDEIRKATQQHQTRLNGVIKEKEEMRSAHATELEMVKAQSNARLDELERQVEAIATAKRHVSKDLSDGYGAELEAVRQDHLRALGGVEQRLAESVARERTMQDELAGTRNQLDEKDESHRATVQRLQEQAASQLDDIQRQLTTREEQHQALAESKRTLEKQLTEKDETHAVHLQGIKKHHATLAADLELQVTNISEQVRDLREKEQQHNISTQAAEEQNQQQLANMRLQLQHRCDEHDRVSTARNAEAKDFQGEIQAMAAKLEEAKMKHAQEVEDLRVSHDRSIQQTKDVHTAEMETLKTHLSSTDAECKRHRAHLQDAEESHAARNLQMGELTEKHSNQIRQIHEQHTAELAAKLLEYNTLVQKMQTTDNDHEQRERQHEQALRAMQSQHAAAMKEKAQQAEIDQAEHHQALAVWTEAATRHRTDLDALAQDHASTLSDHRNELQAIHHKHDESQRELQDLRQSIAELEIEFSDKDQRHADEMRQCKQRHDSLISNRDEAISSLQIQLEKLTAELDSHSRAQNGHMEAIARDGRHTIERVKHTVPAHESDDEIEGAHRRELESVRSEYDGELQALRRELEQVKDNHSKAVIVLQGMQESRTAEFEKWNRQLQILKGAHARELHDRAQELEHLRMTHTAELKNHDNETESLQEQSQAALPRQHDKDYPGSQGNAIKLKDPHAQVLLEKERALSEAADRHKRQFDEMETAHQAQLKQWENSVLQQLQAVQKQNNDRLREIQAATESEVTKATQELRGAHSALQQKYSSLELAHRQLTEQQKQFPAGAASAPALTTPANSSRARSPIPGEEQARQVETLTRQLNDALEEKHASQRQNHTSASELTSLRSRFHRLEEASAALKRQNDGLSNQVLSVHQKLRETEARENGLQRCLEEAVRHERHAERARDALLTRSSSLTPRKTSRHGRRGTAESSPSILVDPTPVTPDRANKDLRVLNESLLLSLNDLRERHQRAQVQLMDLRSTAGTARTGSPASSRLTAYPKQEDLEAAKDRLSAEYKSKLDLVLREKAALESNIKTQFDSSVSAARRQMHSELSQSASPNRIFISETDLPRAPRLGMTPEEGNAKLQELIDEYEARMSTLFECKDLAHPASLTMDASEVGHLVNLHRRASSSSAALASPASRNSSLQPSYLPSRTGSQRNSYNLLDTRERERRDRPRDLGSPSPLQGRHSPYHFPDVQHAHAASLPSSFSAAPQYSPTALDTRHASDLPRASAPPHHASALASRSSSQRGAAPSPSPRKERLYLTERRDGDVSRLLEGSVPAAPERLYVTERGSAELGKSRWATGRGEGAATARKGARTASSEGDEAWWSRA